ncbi:hypothetical protein [Streptomyces indicus]|uniref:Uncharacterized protein n=1 Tax=Streptomyces indicus TaxID=417292 RepID=A0A1G9BLP4_9ACTN|nr:hypothetical protein [Streptomyces indicus]SDK40313.1 hypothetical protein SAMN05421806_107125 [Streptomyces indicus]
MIRPIAGPPRPRHLAYALLLVALLTLGWYAVQPVYESCVVLGEPESYEEAVDAGLCPAPHMRWETWLDQDRSLEH